MPSLLRPTASVAADAVLVGDPGRALLLAQELLVEPKMSNHARGLWGYWGHTPDGRELTIQSTGVGGPSAALVLADLAELGVRRVVRVGTCLGLEEGCELGELLLVGGAVAAGGSVSSIGVNAGETVLPDAALTERLRDSLAGRGREVTVASVDAHPPEAAAPAGVAALDMQTAPLLARAGTLAVGAAALLIVAETKGGERALGRDALEAAEKYAGGVAGGAL